MHTVTWLMALHLFFTYGPKAVDMANGVQQFVQHKGTTNVKSTNPSANNRRNVVREKGSR